VGPTVVEFDVIAFEVVVGFVSCWGMVGSGGELWCPLVIVGSDRFAVIGSVVSCSSLRSKAFDDSRFFVVVEMRLKVLPGLFYGRFVFPSCNGMVVDSCFSKCSEGQFDGCPVLDRIGACSGDSPNAFNADPKTFEGIARVPLLGKFVAVGFQVARLSTLR
jgi:hypothetical protein